MPFNYVIEHMEDDEDTARSIPPWVELEYAHMRALAGRDAHIHFTHLSKSSRDALSGAFQSASGDLAESSCYEFGVLPLMREKGIDLDKVCLLDPKAETALAPADGDGRFEMFLFGGILGDDPPRDRTAELRVLGFPTRHLGPVQMTTDTALGVTKLVVDDKIPLDKIPYVEFPTIRFNAKESVEMPFRYIGNGKEPRLPPGMKELLHEDLNKTFDF
ncbi:Protein arginine N-methyltransferase SFM1 [Hypsizygus marmoreus]|uniref:Protein arginine N-methyltransferase SFM1 n=1 Tax=Hypsizygus marmoreus TaxID=39966 RepID=A0A369J7Q6_HYPMA|nr:Protein arginine N-methyltransferase SFM1 [Hypsizygus marmoreus]